MKLELNFMCNPLFPLCLAVQLEFSKKSDVVD